MYLRVCVCVLHVFVSVLVCLCYASLCDGETERDAWGHCGMSVSRQGGQGWQRQRQVSRQGGQGSRQGGRGWQPGIEPASASNYRGQSCST